MDSALSRDSANTPSTLARRVDGCRYVAVACAARPLPVQSPHGVATKFHPEAPLALSSGLTIRFRVPGERLEAGRHVQKLSVRTREMGVLDIPVTDVAPDGVHDMADSHRVEPAMGASPAPSSRPLKIALIGASSMVFARQLVTDILCAPGLDSVPPW